MRTTIRQGSCTACALVAVYIFVDWALGYDSLGELWGM